MLIDMLRAGACPQQFPPAQLCASSVAVFQVDDVAAYLERLHPQESFDVDFARDMPNLAPLAPLSCFEWSYPWPNPFGVDPPAQRLAVLATVLVDTANDEWVARAARFASQATERGARWMIALHVLLLTPEAQMGYLPVVGALFVTQDGRPCWYSVLAPPGFAGDVAQLETAIKSITLAPLTATCFAHCKGVTTSEHNQPRQQRRATDRAGRPPLVTYKTIDIAPVTRILHDEGHVEETGIKKALHITRGHFARYTDQAPLFGKYTGTFYRPLHVRGTLQAGAVVKDYRVHPAQAEGQAQP